ncbi:MAG: hypothetical protein ACYCZR_04455 [Burkholderiales bacterium]
MRIIHNHKDLQAVRNLPFCYVCGLDFLSEEAKNADHVPAKACFAKVDRAPPLILSTHNACNGENGQNLIDEKMGQLISLKHGPVPKKRDRKLQIVPTKHGHAVGNLDIRGAVWRWVRGFHAALYQLPLFASAPHAIDTPFQVVRNVDGTIKVESLRPQHRKFVEIIKLNRRLDQLDSIRCNNGKLKYECTWIKSDEGIQLCVFALDLYDWKELGRFGNHAQGCVGWYRLQDGSAPHNATQGKVSQIQPPNSEPLDPFGR